MSVEDDLAGGRLRIDLTALVSNWCKLRDMSAPAECGAVVKADAYGCGIEKVVPRLANAGCKTFFVAVPEEGVRARQVAPNARIFVLNGYFGEAHEAYQSYDLMPVLGSPEDLAAIGTAPLPSAIQVDTGMNRLGLSPEEFSKARNAISKLPVSLLMTHYACADDSGHPKTKLQRERFAQLQGMLGDVPMSAANSAAILQRADHQFDLTRPGIAIYGGEALNDTPNAMQAVVTAEARVIRVRDGEKGESVGYGGAETLKRDTRLAYVSVGYADGYHRGASNHGVPMRAISPAAKAWFNGHELNGVGRVSMDMMAFDVTELPNGSIRQGDWIELFGPNIPVDDVARASGTIGYELLTGLGRRYSRRYVG